MISVVCRAKTGEPSPSLARQTQYSILEVRV